MLNRLPQIGITRIHRSVQVFLRDSGTVCANSKALENALRTPIKLIIAHVTRQTKEDPIIGRYNDAWSSEGGTILRWLQRTTRITSEVRIHPSMERAIQVIVSFHEKEELIGTAHFSFAKNGDRVEAGTSEG